MLKSLAPSLGQPAQWGIWLREYGPFILVALGATYPVIRLLLPGVVRPILLLPLLLLLCWFVWRMTWHGGTIISPLALPLLGCAAALSVSSLFGLADSLAVLIELFHWGSVAVLLFLTIDLLASGWHPSLFTRAVLLTATITLLVSAGTVANWWLQWALVWQPGEPWLPVSFRQWMVNFHPNWIGMLINMGVPLAIAEMWRATSRRARWSWGVWLLLATVVLFYTSSRGSWLSTASMTAFVLLPLLWSTWRARHWRRFWTTGLLASGYAVLFLTLFIGNIHAVQLHRSVNVQSATISITPAAPTAPAAPAAPANSPPAAQPADSADTDQLVRGLTATSGRGVFWGRAIEFFQERPITGLGPAGYKQRYQSVEPHSQKFQAEHAHNIYLTILSETGLLGVAALLWLALAALWVWVHAWRRPPGSAPEDTRNEQRLLLLSTAAVGIGMLVHGMVDVPEIWMIGLVLYTLAAGLAAGSCWSLSSVAQHRRGWSLLAGRHTLLVQPVHLVLVVAAILAWGSSIGAQLQRNRWEGLRAAGMAALQRGEPAEALELYKEAIAVYPQGGIAYSEGAATLAWLALDNPALLPEALAAQAQVDQHDPMNLVVPLNRGALLLDMGQQAQAEASLQTFVAFDRSRQATPYLLLARLYEQQGAVEKASEHWQQALNNQPALAQSAACVQSALCAALPIPTGEYAALVAARELLDAPDAAALRQIERLAMAWNSVDIWAVGVPAAQQAGDAQAAARFLVAAVDLSETVGKKSTTRQLAIVLLRDAVQREDHQTVREVIDRWTQPDRYTVPQVTRHLVTVTDLEFARTAVEAALALDEPQALQQASAYLQWVQHAWQAAEQGE